MLTRAEYLLNILQSTSYALVLEVLEKKKIELYFSLKAEAIQTKIFHMKMSVDLVTVLLPQIHIIVYNFLVFQYF